MKKMILILAIFVLLFCFNAVQATSETVEVNFIVPEILNEDVKTFETSIFVGNIEGLDETQKEVEISGNLVYDKNIIESVKIEGLNGWNISYLDGKIAGNIDNIIPNKEIAKITVNLKKGIKEKQIIEIKLNNFLVTNYENLEQTFNFTKQINTKVVENENIIENQNSVNNVVNENKVKNTIENNIQNESNSKNQISKLPNAGFQNKIVVPILLIILIILGIKIKEKEINF